MRLTRNHAVISPTMQRQGSLITRWPRLKNSEHAQSVEVIVGVVMGQKVVLPKPDRPYRLLRLCVTQSKITGHMMSSSGSVSVIQSKITGHMMYSSGSVSVIQSKITGHMM